MIFLLEQEKIGVILEEHGQKSNQIYQFWLAQIMFDQGRPIIPTQSKFLYRRHGILELGKLPLREAIHLLTPQLTNGLGPPYKTFWAR